MRNASRRRALLTLAISAVALVGVWRVSPPTTSAIYDGACTRVPYRYFSPPPDAPAAPKPDPESQTIAVTGGQQPTLAVTTDEGGTNPENVAQAQLIASNETFTVPRGAGSVVVSIAPVTPPSTPSDGTIASNVYNFSVKANGAELPQTSPVTIVILTEVVPDSGSYSIEQHTASGWKQISPTVAIGACSGNFGASVTSLGDFAVVRLGATGSAATAATDGSTAPLVWAGGSLLAIAVLAGIIVSIRRRRATPPRGR